MKPSTLLLSTVFFAMGSKASRWYDMETNTFSNYPSSSVQSSNLMATYDFQIAINNGRWSLADEIYDNYRLDLLPLNEKLDILKEAITRDQTDAISTIMANFQFTREQLDQFPFVTLVQSKPMLDVLVDSFDFNLNPGPHPWGIPIEPKAQALLEAKRQEKAFEAEAEANTQETLEIFGYAPTGEGHNQQFNDDDNNNFLPATLASTFDNAQPVSNEVDNEIEFEQVYSKNLRDPRILMPVHWSVRHKHALFLIALILIVVAVIAFICYRNRRVAAAAEESDPEKASDATTTAAVPTFTKD